MNILIPDFWLREYLVTNASPKELANALSLCGPSFENKIKKINGDFVYEIEVTTNRVDMMSVLGIVREAKAILPQFGFKAKTKKLKYEEIKSNKPLDIKIINNPSLCHRVLAVKLENVNLTSSPKWMQEKLIKVGQRPLINAIDITNYVMWEVGHPIHVFDYDRLKNKKIVIREAKKGESLITLDNKKHILEGGEVVFGNGKGEIIDLPGVMGTANTTVTKNTKNVLLWIESVNATKIRFASMSHSIRSQAAILNEKHVDPNLGLKAILRGVYLFKKITKAKVASNLTDIYPKRPKPKSIKTTKEFIDQRLGIKLTKSKIKNILNSLGFETIWKGNNLTVHVASYRLHDMNIAEDIVEEVARIYGYHNLPSKLMDGKIPETIFDSPFAFEMKIKNILKGYGANEVYTLSLVPKSFVEKEALSLTNPLGPDSKYLRTSLCPSLVQAAKTNSGEKEPFHLFEISNVYLPKKGKLPEEKMMLAGILSNITYRKARGVVEALLNELNIQAEIEQKDIKIYSPNKGLIIRKNNQTIGSFGILDNSEFIYYEFDVNLLSAFHNAFETYKPISKYPPQIEDITLSLPERTKVGDVIGSILNSHKNIVRVILFDTYKDSYTFRVWYQNPDKTLKDGQVKEIRIIMLGKIKKRFGAGLKD